MVNKHWFFLLLILGLVARLAMSTGVASQDSYFYVQHAADLLQGRFNMPVQTYVDFYRYPVWMPISLFFFLFGVNDLSSIIWPFICGAGALLTIYFLGRLLFGAKTALLALFVLGFLPMDIIISTQVMPDIMVEFFSALVIFVFLRSEIRPDVNKWAAGLLSGVLMGFAICARALTAILGIPLIVYAYWKKSFKWHYLAIFFGTILVMGFTYLISLRQTGDPFFEYRISEKLYDGLYKAFKFDPAYSASKSVLSLSYYPKAMFGITRYGLANFSVFGYLFLAATIYAFIKRRKEVIILIVWIIPVLLYLQFGVINFKNFTPIFHEERYLSIITIPAVLLVAFFLKEGVRNKVICGVVLFLFASTSFYGAYRIKRNLLIDAQPYKAVYAYLKEQPKKPIYSIHYRWPLYLNYYFKYTTGYNFFEDMNGSNNSLLKLVHPMQDYRKIKDAYVVIHHRYVFFDDSGNPPQKRPELPDYVYSPPSDWKLLKHFEFYGKGNKVDIYLVL